MPLTSSSSLLSAETLPIVIDSIKSCITSAGHPPNIEAVREVDRRLKLCKNPEKVVGSSAYLAKQTEEAKKAEEKRNRKAVEVQQIMNDGDPFGNELGASRPAIVDYDDDDDDDD
jgi:cyclin H